MADDTTDTGEKKSSKPRKPRKQRVSGADAETKAIDRIAMRHTKRAAELFLQGEVKAATAILDRVQLFKAAYQSMVVEGVKEGTASARVPTGSE